MTAGPRSARVQGARRLGRCPHGIEKERHGRPVTKQPWRHASMRTELLEDGTHGWSGATPAPRIAARGGGTSRDRRRRIDTPAARSRRSVEGFARESYVARA